MYSKVCLHACRQRMVQAGKSAAGKRANIHVGGAVATLPRQLVQHRHFTPSPPPSIMSTPGKEFTRLGR